MAFCFGSEKVPTDFKVSNLIQFALLLHPFPTLSFFVEPETPFKSVKEMESIQPFQLQAFHYKTNYGHRVQTINIWTAVCDERLSASLGRKAVHVLAYWEENLIKSKENLQNVKEHWKGRFFFHSEHNVSNNSVDLPLNLVLAGFQEHVVVFSCFFFSRHYQCPSHISLITGIISFNVCFFSKLAVRYGQKFSFFSNFFKIEHEVAVKVSH